MTITPRSQSYGDLAPGVTRAQDYTLRLAATYPVGKRVPLSVRVTFAGVLSPTLETFTVPTGQPAATPTKFTYAGPVVPIPDASPAGVSVTIPVSGIGYASKVRFSVDGATCSTATGATTVGIDHTFVGDLTGTLISPSGVAVRLFQRNGGSGNNLCQVVFDDSAARAFSSVRRRGRAVHRDLEAVRAVGGAARRVGQRELDVPRDRRRGERHGFDPCLHARGDGVRYELSALRASSTSRSVL